MKTGWYILPETPLLYEVLVHYDESVPMRDHGIFKFTAAYIHITEERRWEQIPEDSLFLDLHSIMDIEGPIDIDKFLIENFVDLI